MVIAILGPEYPKRIWTKFESEHFKKRLGTGEVVPIVLEGTPLSLFDRTATIGYIEWKSDKEIDEQANRTADMLLMKCAEVRKKRLSRVEQLATSGESAEK